MTIIKNYEPDADLNGDLEAPEDLEVVLADAKKTMSRRAYDALKDALVGDIFEEVSQASFTFFDNNVYNEGDYSDCLGGW